MASFVHCPTFAQFLDDFSDQEIETSPPWQGSTGEFAVNSSGQLQLAAAAAGSSWLSTAFMVSHGEEVVWELWLKESFAPSGANFSRIYLMSDQPDLLSPLNGYYLQLGESGSNDAIELFRQTGSDRTSICRGTQSLVSAPFAIRLRVTKSATGGWTVSADYAGGSNFIIEASGQDASHTTSSYFGIACVYTISNAANFFYDDVSITKRLPPDTSPPSLLSAESVSLNSFVLTFSEPLAPVPAEAPSNYSVEGIGEPYSARLFPNGGQVELLFDSLPNGQTLNLHLAGLNDTTGNAMAPAVWSFLFFSAQETHYRDVIINEILADPEPSVGMPAAEFIELLNRGPHPVQLEGWTFTDSISFGRFSDFLLMPDSHVVVCARASVADFYPLTPTVALDNFPTLNNSADRLFLIEEDGALIDTVSYSKAWFRDEDKAGGGWTLERIDPENICQFSLNWVASSDAAGGTPGSQNSAFNLAGDSEGPAPVNAEVLSDTVIRLEFNEPLLPSSLSPDAINIDPHPGNATVAFTDPTGSAIDVRLADPLDLVAEYQISTRNLSDCYGNRQMVHQDGLRLKLDTIPAGLVGVTALSDVAMKITFSERVAASPAEDPNNYTLSYSGVPASVMLMPDGSSVELKLAEPFPNGLNQTVTIKGVTDLAGNVSPGLVADFLYFKALPLAFRDIRITEIYADPSPTVGLPDGEFLELFNNSDHVVNLSRCWVTDGTTVCPLDSMLLHPGQYVILASHGLAEAFASERVMALSALPSLNNSEDMILIKDQGSQIIDSIFYSTSWYRDSEKAEGGWSLELIDATNLCAARDNWSASEDPSGGTPGRENSVFAHMPDHVGPEMTGVHPLSSDTLLVTFSEKLERTLPYAGSLTVTPDIPVVGVAFADGLLTSLKVYLGEPLTPGEDYLFSAERIYDCTGNPIQSGHAQLSFVLPQEAQPGDLVINEVLFNPRTTGTDFVEIYNQSDKAVDLTGFHLVTRSPSGAERSVAVTGRRLCRGGEYLVFTKDPVMLKREYLAGHEETFLSLDLPPLTDDAGAVRLLSASGLLLDSMRFDQEMHSPFVKDPEGVSLERISANRDGYAPDNWRSASSAEGFATPGYRNSNARELSGITSDDVVVEPEIIQPDAPGQDFARISYAFKQGGLVANITIFDSSGRRVRQIAQGELLGNAGAFRWDGDTDAGGRAHTGYYMIWFQAFDASGRVHTVKKRVVVY